MVEEMGRLTSAGVPPAEAAHEALKLLDPESAESAESVSGPAAVPRARRPAVGAAASPDTFLRRGGACRAPPYGSTPPPCRTC